jgi:hypothetical protein
VNPVVEVSAGVVWFCVPPFPPTNPLGEFVGCVELSVLFEEDVVLLFYDTVTGEIFLFIITIAAMSTPKEIALVETVVAKVVVKRGSEDVDKVEVVKVLPYCYHVSIDIARVPRGPTRDAKLKMLKTLVGAKKYISEVKTPSPRAPQL